MGYLLWSFSKGFSELDFDRLESFRSVFLYWIPIVIPGLDSDRWKSFRSIFLDWMSIDRNHFARVSRIIFRSIGIQSGKTRQVILFSRSCLAVSSSWEERKLWYAVTLRACHLYMIDGYRPATIKYFTNINWITFTKYNYLQKQSAWLYFSESTY